MATFDYLSMQNTATELLKQFGNPFTLKKKSSTPVYNPKTKKTEIQYFSYTGICVMKTYSAEAIGSLGNIINAGEVTFVCSMDDKSIIPDEQTDKVVFNGVSYNIIDIATSNPSGDTVLVHFLHCKKA